MTIRFRYYFSAVTLASALLTQSALAAGGVYNCDIYSEAKPDQKQHCTLDSTTGDLDKQKCEVKTTDDTAVLCFVSPIRSGLFSGTDSLLCLFKKPMANMDGFQAAITKQLMSAPGAKILSFPEGGYGGGYTTIFPGVYGNVTATYKEKSDSDQWQSYCYGQNNKYDRVYVWLRQQC